MPLFWRQVMHAFTEFLQWPGELLDARSLFVDCGPELLISLVTNHRRRTETRETRVGQFLRYTRTEDLPQLVNVLRGEMSLTGCGWAWPHFFD